MNDSTGSPDHLHMLGCQYLGAVRETVQRFQRQMHKQGVQFCGDYAPQEGVSTEVPLDDGPEIYFQRRNIAGRQVAMAVARATMRGPGEWTEYTISFKRRDSRMIVSKDGKEETICISGYYHWSVRRLDKPPGGPDDDDDLDHGEAWKK